MTAEQLTPRGNRRTGVFVPRHLWHLQHQGITATWHHALHLMEILIPPSSCLIDAKSSFHLGVCRVRRVRKKLPEVATTGGVPYLLSHPARSMMLLARASWNQEMKELSVPDYCSPTVNCRRRSQITGWHCETCISSSGKSACRPHVACVRL